MALVTCSPANQPAGAPVVANWDSIVLSLALNPDVNLGGVSFWKLEYRALVPPRPKGGALHSGRNHGRLVGLIRVSLNQHERIAQFVDVVACPGQNGSEPPASAGDRGTKGGRGAAPPKLTDFIAKIAAPH